MNKKKINLLTLGVLTSSVFLTGCNSGDNYTNIEKVVYASLSSNEVVKIIESDSNKQIKGHTLKDVEIVLNLDNLSKSIAYEQSLEKVTMLLGVLDSALENEINDYVFKVNSSKLDIYGNKQKVKVIEVSIDKDTVNKINFDNFDYLNLDKICKVTKFKYLTEVETEAETEIETETKTENKEPNESVVN